MTAGIEDDPQKAQRARAGSTAAATTVTACLTDEEWERATPGIEIGSQDRADQQCLLETLADLERWREAMLAAQEGDLTNMANAAAECGPGHGPHAPDAADGTEHRGNASSRTGYTHARADRNGDDGAVDTRSDDGNDHPGDHRRRDSRGHPRL